MDSPLFLNIVILPVLLTLGMATSHEDLKTSKIKHIFIATGLIFALGLYALALAGYTLDAAGILKLVRAETLCGFVWNIDRWAVNLIISTIVAYAIWRNEGWGAGDAKLFIVYASLIPMCRYPVVYFHYYFASFFLLLAIFIPASIYVVAVSTGSLLRKGVAERKKLTRALLCSKIKLLYQKRGEIMKLAVGLIDVFLLIRLVRMGLGQQSAVPWLDQNMVSFLLLLGFRRIEPFFLRNFKITLACFIGLLACFAFISPLWSSFVLKVGGTTGRSFLFLVVYRTARAVIGFFADRSEKHKIPFAPWMFLGALITWFGAPLMRFFR